MDRSKRALVFHIVAVAFATFGLLVLIPHPELWTHLPGANYSYRFAMQYMGPLHIIAGAVAMVLYGLDHVGRRETAVFFGAAVCLSLSFELLGTGTGWPFGAYEYTMGLGVKVLGRVPYSIPLSWFYLSFSSYLLARRIITGLAPRLGAPGTVALGVWLLTAWDLVLDPAMAHEDMPMVFWRWHEQGAYLGMPLINLGGWMMTGAAIMVVSRALWREDLPPGYDIAIPYGVYVTNLLFGAVLCASVGLFWPIGLALVAGIAPASLVWRVPAGSDP